MNVFFFGPQDLQLYGAYHAPDFSRDRRAGIVLCPPVGQGYIRTHRAFLQLANRLSAAGYHVLRFDYSATGDSAGESASGHPRQWITDIGLAVQELRDTADMTHISLIGLRLGATLAAVYAAGAPEISRLLLWEPALNGRTYLAGLASAQDQWLADLLYPPPAEAVQPKSVEYGGFPYPETLHAGIEELDLFALRPPGHQEVLILQNQKEPTARPLADLWVGHTRSCLYRHLPGARIWVKESGGGAVLIPAETLSAITDYFCGEAE